VTMRLSGTVTEIWSLKYWTHERRQKRKMEEKKKEEMEWEGKGKGRWKRKGKVEKEKERKGEGEKEWKVKERGKEMERKQKIRANAHERRESLQQFRFSSLAKNRGVYAKLIYKYQILCLDRITIVPWRHLVNDIDLCRSPKSPKKSIKPPILAFKVIQRH